MKKPICLYFWVLILIGNLIIGSTTGWGLFFKIAALSNCYIIAEIIIYNLKISGKKKGKIKKIPRCSEKEHLKAV